MTHESEGTVIHFTTPVEIATVKTKAGYCGLALLLAGFLIGLLF